MLANKIYWRADRRIQHALLVTCGDGDSVVDYFDAHHVARQVESIWQADGQNNVT